MFFVIDDKSGELLQARMKNWVKLEEIINKSELIKNRILFLAHEAVRMKLEAANMHIQMLIQSYTIKETTENKIGPKQSNFLRRTMFDNVIFNLSSLLDSIAHEINQIYGYKVDINFVNMDHNHVQNGIFCIRCKLNSENDELASLLNWEFPRRYKNSMVQNFGWYGDFSNYRNHIMHRTILFLHMTPGAAWIPDDPTVFDMQGLLFDENGKPVFGKYTVGLMKNFETEKEMRLYSMDCFEKILEITEKIYGYLIEKLYKK